MAEIGNDILKAQIYLERGNLVSVPTETVYGLAGNALDPDAVTSIFKVKNRPNFDPLIVHVPSLDRAAELVTHLHDDAYKLAQQFWPGPLTILMEKSSKVSDLITSGMDRVAIRIPSHPLTLKLLKMLDFPIVAPSANPFGYISPTKAQHVQDQLGDRIPYILNGGQCNIGIESTIVGWDKDKPVIYRLGGIPKEKLEDVIGSLKVMAHSTSNPKAPGMLKSHYAPKRKVLIGNVADLIKENNALKIGVITFKETVLTEKEVEQIVLAPDGKMETAAKNLFSALRDLDKKDLDVILVEEVPSHGLGRAINDRLRRAAAPPQAF